MGISSSLSKIFKSYSPELTKRLIKLCWSDKVSVKEIEKEFNLSANQIEKFMRFSLSGKDFKRWMVRRHKKFNLKSKKASIIKNDQSI
tara:strand:- start:59 stop:322 length:264 start_codon:yes stop_codon:yes gene_type:complete